MARRPGDLTTPLTPLSRTAGEVAAGGDLGRVIDRSRPPERSRLAETMPVLASMV
jgi:hypothetical protein